MLYDVRMLEYAREGMLTGCTYKKALPEMALVKPLQYSSQKASYRNEEIEQSNERERVRDQILGGF